MNKKILTPVLLGFLALISVGCTDARTTSDAPSSVNQTATPMAKSTETAKNDAQSETRAKQLDADIRATEQRNNALGNPVKRNDGDLATEVRSKLEANIPGGNLTVAAKDGVVTVAGTVSNQDQLNKIQPLGMEIKGVQSVMVKAVVKPPAS
jgi:hyperosmotically inducible periplasmic protein